MLKHAEVINPITVDNFCALFNYTPVDLASDSMMARPRAMHFRVLVTGARSLLLGIPGLNLCSTLASDFQWCCLAVQGYPIVTQLVVFVESPSLLLHSIQL